MDRYIGKVLTKIYEEFNFFDGLLEKVDLKFEILRNFLENINV